MALPNVITTMTPSDFPNDQATVMHSRSPLDEAVKLPASPSFGISQVLVSTIDTRCSLSPRIVQRLLVPVAWSSMIDFTTCGRLVTINGVTRPNRIHFRYGWRLCSSGSHPSDNYSSNVPSNYMSNRQFTWQPRFRLQVQTNFLAIPQHSIPAVGQTLPGRLDLQGTLRKVLYMLTLHDFTPFTDFLTQKA